MNETRPFPEAAPGNPTREEIMSALFANMVIQQINMAMMFLGKVAHPETGEFIQDTDTARMFIDQLEMLEAKTKGNVSREEAALLKQGLTALHMAFVEAVNAPPAQGQPALHHDEPAAAAPAEAPAPAAPAPAAAAAPQPAEAAPEESRKKFSKKY
jgi:hypothetical protein